MDSINKRTDDNAALKYNPDQLKCDCSLFILSSNYQPVSEFVFRDAFPISLTTLSFDAGVTDVNYFTAETVIRYNYYDYFVWDAAQSTDSSMKPNYRRSQEGVQL